MNENNKIGQETLERFANAPLPLKRGAAEYLLLNDAKPRHVRKKLRLSGRQFKKAARSAKQRVANEQAKV